jgi:hypothetical protein
LPALRCHSDGCLRTFGHLGRWRSHLCSVSSASSGLLGEPIQSRGFRACSASRWRRVRAALVLN